jgi:cold shock CspA family protein
MKGTIKTYLPEKQYGFIKGDDGKDYFFHKSEFRDKSNIENLCEEALVSFEQQATAKGYKAKNCALINSLEVSTFVTPDEFITSRSDNIRGWDVIEYGRWIVHGTSRNSPDAAKKDVIDSATRIGSNSLINLEYYKTTGSEGGTGNGIHHYTIHNFSGRAVTIGRRNSKGKHRANDLQGLNDRAESLKTRLESETDARKKASKKKRNIIWAVILMLSLFVIGMELDLIIALLTIFVLLIVGAILGCFTNDSTNYDWWLERS